MGEPARLIASSLSPVPDGGVAEWVAGAGGLRLRAALFAAQKARGSVILSPGRTEPIEKYFETVEDLRSRGFTVLVHDWRGHGLSARLLKDPMKGHALGWRPFLEDYTAILAAFEARLPRPWIGLGHSMGGGLTALVLVEDAARLDGAVLSAPMMGVDLGKVPTPIAAILSGLLTALGCGGLYAARSDPLGSFEDNILTHDRTRWERTYALLTEAPELRVGGVTWGWLSFATGLSAQLRRASTERLSAPVTVVAAGQERLVDNLASHRFVERLAHGRYVEIPEARHEILMETDAVRARFWTEFDAVAARVSGG